MSVKSLAVGAVAPEAAAATTAAGAVSKSPNSAAAHRAKIDAIKAKRPAQVPPPVAPVAQAEPDSPPPASLGGGPSLPAVPAAAATGSGVLLGVFAWAAGLAYLQGGSAGVKKFLNAKFFNKT